MAGLVKRILQALLPSNRYESAYQPWGQRSWLPASLQDMRFDADASTRLELVRRARYWERNNPLVNASCDAFEQWTVGTGLQCVPASSNEEWNKKAQAWWDGWCANCDLTTRQPFSTVQGLAARSWFIDGDVFILKTKSPDTGRPRIQLIEGHRCQTPGDDKQREGKDIADGVHLNSFGRPVGYYFATGSYGSTPFYVPRQNITYSETDAEFVTHVFEPSRPAQARGISFLHPVMNILHDMDDLQNLEMQKAKANADVAYAVTTATGELDTSKMRKVLMTIQSQDAAGTAVKKDVQQYYQTTLGGRIVGLRPGEDLKQFASESPSAATQWYWEYLAELYCMGVGIPRLLLMPDSMQGTVARAVYDSAANFFRCRSAIIQTAVRDIYLWAMSYARFTDPELRNAPADWQSVIVHPPRSVNTDVGYNSSANLAELEAGVANYAELFGVRGKDWRNELRQKAVEAAYIKALASEFSLQTSDIAARKTAPAAHAEPDGDEGEGPQEKAEGSEPKEKEDK